MLWYVRIALGLVVCSAGAPALAADPPAKPKARVEFRWLESKRIEGVTTLRLTTMEGPTERLAEWNDADKARDFVAWLREKLPVRESFPLD